MEVLGFAAKFAFSGVLENRKNTLLREFPKSTKLIFEWSMNNDSSSKLWIIVNKLHQ